MEISNIGNVWIIKNDNGTETRGTKEQILELLNPPKTISEALNRSVEVSLKPLPQPEPLPMPQVPMYTPIEPEVRLSQKDMASISRSKNNASKKLIGWNDINILIKAYVAVSFINLLCFIFIFIVMFSPKG